MAPGFYSLDGTDSQPHPPAGRPRILISGIGPKRTLRTAARFGHEWNSIVLTPENYKTSVAIMGASMR